MSELNREYIEEQLEEILESNALIKSAAQMVGFDVDAETDRALEGVDRRVSVNLHQRGRINTLKSLLDDE